MRRLPHAVCVALILLAMGCGGSAHPRPAPGPTAWTTVRVVVFKKNSPHSAQVMVLKRNVRVKVLHCGGGWCRVRHGQRTGWVRASELTWRRG